jgi:hypothetical protein
MLRFTVVMFTRKWSAAHTRKRPDELPIELSRFSGDNEVVIKGSITEEVILLKNAIESEG